MQNYSIPLTLADFMSARATLLRGTHLKNSFHQARLQSIVQEEQAIKTRLLSCLGLSTKRI